MLRDAWLHRLFIVYKIKFMKEKFDEIIADFESKYGNGEGLDESIEEGRRNWLDFLRNNHNNLSYWLDKVKVVEQMRIRVPKTQIAKVPEDLFDRFFLEKAKDYELIEEWVKKEVMPLIGDMGLPFFIKNGCFSNKFDFGDNCLVNNKDLKEVTRHICNIQMDSLMFDTGGNLEIVIREWIKPEEGTECIYNGMPLRPEMRLFYDFDEHKYLYDANYWDWDYCHDAICGNKEQKAVYERQYPIISEKLENRRGMFLPTILKALNAITGLSGKWSVDFILDKDGAWLIDMADAYRSAYWDENKIK